MEKKKEGLTLEEVPSELVDAIQNLGTIAKDLKAGNDITLPGSLKVKGGLEVEKEIKTKDKVIVDRRGQEWSGCLYLYAGEKEAPHIGFYDKTGKRNMYLMGKPQKAHMSEGLTVSKGIEAENVNASKAIEIGPFTKC